MKFLPCLLVFTSRTLPGVSSGFLLIFFSYFFITRHNRHFFPSGFLVDCSGIFLDVSPGISLEGLPGFLPITYFKKRSSLSFYQRFSRSFSWHFCLDCPVFSLGFLPGILSELFSTFLPDVRPVFLPEFLSSFSCFFSNFLQEFLQGFRLKFLLGFFVGFLPENLPKILSRFFQEFLSRFRPQNRPESLEFLFRYFSEISLCVLAEIPIVS